MGTGTTPGSTPRLLFPQWVSSLWPMACALSSGLPPVQVPCLPDCWGTSRENPEPPARSASLGRKRVPTGAGCRGWGPVWTRAIRLSRWSLGAFCQLFLNRGHFQPLLLKLFSCPFRSSPPWSSVLRIRRDCASRTGCQGAGVQTQRVAMEHFKIHGALRTVDAF